MPRFWATTGIGFIRIGGLFTGLIKLLMAFATLFGFVILMGVAWVFLPAWVWILFFCLLAFGVVLGIVGIVQNSREEDTDPNG